MTPLPNNTAAERHLIGVLLRDAAPFPPALKASDFFEPSHQDIVAAALSLEADGIPADELTVSQRLRDMASQVQAVDVSLLVSDAGHSAYRPSHVALITDAAALRTILASTKDAQDPDHVLAHMARLAAERKARAPKHGPTRMDFDDLLSFNRRDDTNSVIGNRWLCKGGSLLIVGQSGTGKSSLMMQAAVRWCLGLDFFGIQTHKPLRAVVLQAENDQGDVAEALQDVIAGAYLDQAQLAQLKENLAIFRDTISTGTAFTDALRALIVDHRADIVFVDPLLSFTGIDVSDQEQASKFLRHDLAPILLETGAILVAMHHTGKPKSAADKEGSTIADLAYSGLGSSEFTNYFREVAVLARCKGDEPIFKFGLTKRSGRGGLKDAQGQFAYEIHIRHAAQKGVIRWEYSQPPVAPEADGRSGDADCRPAKGSPRRLNLGNG